MMQSKRWATALLAMGGMCLLPSAAQAEFWNGLSTKPDPNLIVGLDSSVTMNINVNCSGCHKGGGSNPGTRMWQAADQFRQALPLFQDYFAMGGFQYEGCGSAKIRGGQIQPTPANKATSYLQVDAMLTNPVACGSRENFLPGAGSANTSGCLVAAAGCANDVSFVENILENNTITGLNPGAPVAGWNSFLNSTIVCDLSGGPAIDIQTELQALSGSSSFPWPRWNGNVNGGNVNSDLCLPLATAFATLRGNLQACSTDGFTSTSSVFDMDFLDLGIGSWCTPGTIATNDPCGPGGGLLGTCTCDDSDPDCGSGFTASSACLTPFTWKARQQVAVCEAYQPTGFFGQYFNAQPDNIVHGTDPTQYCRENVAMFITDGYMGHRAGVFAEAQKALTATYRSQDGLSNMFVMHVSSEFTGQADTMAQFVQDDISATRFSATNQNQTKLSLARILNRTYKGVYAGGNFGTDAFQTRAAFHTFTVPGYDPSSPNSSGTAASDDYLGFPSRMTVNELRDNGTLGPIIFETDWASKATATVPGCGPFNYDGNTSIGAWPSSITDIMGPDGSFPINGVQRAATLTSSDRNGDGVIDAQDSNPPNESIRYGRSYGFAHTTPIVVERARDAVGAFTSAGKLAYGQFNTKYDGRARMYYTMAGGYVLGYYGGARVAGANYGNLQRTDGYDDSSAAAGREVFRYRPRWINDGTNTGYTYTDNALLQQPLTTGQLLSRDVYVDIHYDGGAHQEDGGSLNDHVYTVVVGNQGREGRGYFVAEASNPCTPPEFITEIRLPAGDRASAEPTIYPVRVVGNRIRNMLITVSGLDTANAQDRMYMYDITRTANGTSGDYSINLPTGPAQPLGGRASYATKPVCVDASGNGAGAITHCYAVRTDGFVARVEVRATGAASGFVTVDDLTPLDAGGSPATMNSGRYFYTAPVAFFGPKGEVNLVFGSGNFEDLTLPESGNFVYRMKDNNFLTTAGTANGDLDNVCRPAGPNTEGIFALPAGHRLLSSPIVADGVVAWTTYQTNSNGCTNGVGTLYAMDYADCTDVQAPGLRPAGVNKGQGIPTAPVLHRQSDTLLVQTSADTRASDVDTASKPSTRTGLLPSLALPTYWRLELKIP